LTTISLTASFDGLEIPGFTVSVLPALPAGLVDDEAAASLADFDELLTVLSEDDDDDDEVEYQARYSRAKLHAQHRDCDTNSETG